jgi:hypothetical protein
MTFRDCNNQKDVMSCTRGLAEEMKRCGQVEVTSEAEKT